METYGTFSGLQAHAGTKLAGTFRRATKFAPSSCQILYSQSNVGAVRYGCVVKALVTYVQTVEQAYAAKRSLYRGMRLPEYHVTENYVVGRIVTWHAFASTTTDRQLAESYARQDCDRGLFGSEGVPVLFVIQTAAGRGAALPGNAACPELPELLLTPFMHFEVTSVTVERHSLWVPGPQKCTRPTRASQAWHICKLMHLKDASVKVFPRCQHGLFTVSLVASGFFSQLATSRVVCGH